MPKKINSVSLRLGKNKFWPLRIQNYGKYFSLPNYYFITLHLFNLYTRSQFILNQIFITFSNKKIYFDIYYSFINLNVTVKNNKYNLKQNNKVSLSSYKFKPNLNLFLKSKFFTSAQFLALYFKKLVLDGIAIKKAVSMITFLLINKINFEKIIYSKFGLQKVKLKGFKFSLIGRFENTKNQMAKKSDFSYGILPLLSLNNHVEYSKVILNSNLGSWSFQLWLFYK